MVTFPLEHVIDGWEVTSIEPVNGGLDDTTLTLCVQYVLSKPKKAESNRFYCVNLRREILMRTGARNLT